MAWDVLLSGVEKLLHWFSPRFMLFVLLLSSALFFMPPAWAARLSLDGWIASHRAWLSGGMIISAVYLIPFGVLPIVEKKYHSKKAKEGIRDNLRNLPGYEAALVRRCLLNDGRATEAIADKGTAKSLEKKGILWESVDHTVRGGVAYSITSAAYTVLKEPEFSKKFSPEKSG